MKLKLLLIFCFFAINSKAQIMIDKWETRETNDVRKLNKSKTITPFFVPIGRIWEHKIITYHIANGTADIINSDENQAIRSAFDLWQVASDLLFIQVCNANDADIVLSWENFNHGDPVPACYPGLDAFDGQNGVLAHSMGGPGPNNCNNQAGDIHFDDAETWTTDVRVGPGQPIDLVTVAAHEIGHSLGLFHTTVAGSLMEALYNGSHRFLGADDIAGIQSLYGAPSNNFISGPSQICTSETYTIPNLPAGATVSWSIAPVGIATFTTSGNSVTFTKVGNTDNATITATVSTSCDIVTLTKANIGVDIPNIPGLPNGPFTVGINNTYAFHVPDDGNMEWAFEGNASNYNYTISSNGYTCYFTPTALGTYTVKVRSSYGSCGYSAYASATVNCAVVKPDLVIESANLSVSGSNMTINYSVANTGIASAGSFYVGYYLSADGLFDASDTYLGATSFGPLAFGANASGSETFIAPTTPMYVIIVADAFGSVDEIYETNNARELADLAMYRMAPPNGSDTFTVYPNPANTELKIAYKTETKTSYVNPFNVKLLNQEGKVLKEGVATKKSTEVTLQVADVPDGIYYLHIYEGKKVSKQQVVIGH